MREGVNKVALRLFEHNEKAYHAAVRMMDQYGKAAIVHPTGTGKSYIAFKLDRKSTRLNSSHKTESRMPSSA